MTLDERRQYLTTMLERHKARAYDLQQQLDQTSELIHALLGAMETVDDMLAVEKRTAETKPVE